MKVEIRNLKKTFDEHTLFSNFNLTVKKGEFVGLLGESGAGKTTLLNMIGFIEDIDSGSILYNDIHIKNKKMIRKLLQKDVGFIFQNYGLIDNQSVAYNFKFISPQKISIRMALDSVGLDYVDLGRKIYTLSGGEQQRIALAKVIYKDVSVILADEATASIDDDNKIVVMEILKKLNEEGKTIIFVTHDQSLVPYFNRIIHLKHKKGSR